MQTISDLANQLRRLISVQDYIPAVEVRGQLEQLLTQEQLIQAEEITDLFDITDLIRLNVSKQRQEVDQVNDTLVKIQIEHEQQLMHLARENQALVQ